MWNRLRRTTAPSGDIVTLDQAKAHLRVDFADDDDIQDMIYEAVNVIDGPKGIGVALLPQSWVMSLDIWPNGSIIIPLGPIISVDSIIYIDPNGNEQTLDTSLYVYDLDTEPLYINRAFGVAWPASRYQIGSIKVNFTAGYANADAIPSDFKRALKLLIGHWYKNREAVVGIESRDTPNDMPFAVESILERYRAGRIC